MRAIVRLGAGLAIAAAFVASGTAKASAAEPVPAAAEPQVHPCAQTKQQAWQLHGQEILSPPVMAAAQADYDVKYYDLWMRVNTTLPRRIFGKATMRAQVVSASLDSCLLNFRGSLTVNSVKVNGVAAGFVRNGAQNTITISLNGAKPLGTVFETYIDYEGAPGGAFTFSTMGSGISVSTLSEPYGARTWWPCKDWPDDKADSMAVHFDFPNTYKVASNGSLQGVSFDSTRVTYNWKERYPIATYLVSIAAHPYAFYNDWYHYGAGDSMEVQHYVFPEDSAASRPAFDLTVDMLEAFAARFGEYPFVNEKYGHAETTFGGGMEHQTCTSLGALSEYIVAHELGHQWGGDKITCETFSHIWLNEGWASFCESVWAEATGGTGAYRDYMDGQVYYGPGTIIVEDPIGGDIFNTDLSYHKASWVFHMLRGMMGDSLFFDTMTAYMNEPGLAYGSATTAEFQAFCEAETGLDLDDFFAQWIYGEYYPIYEFDWSASDLGGGQWEVALGVDQTQSWQIFHMPLPVTVTTASGDTTITVDNDAAHQDYVLTVNGEPLRVQLDKDHWILRQVNEPMPALTLDRGILVVNGVDWDTYGSEILSAYQDSVFWGDNPISFWDTFASGPSGGYPANLPAPLGHGLVPPDTLKQFSAVVWVGNAFGGDLAKWFDSPIYGYLQGGGNVLLLTRWGQNFVTEPFRSYLGITWREGDTPTTGTATAVYPGLATMTTTGSQSLSAAFDTTLATGESVLLFKDLGSFTTPRGLGVIRQPAAGGTYRPDGGRFAYVSGRPYRYSHAPERANVEFILEHFFNEPFTPATSVAGGGAFAWRTEVTGVRPNPFNPKTSVSFSLAERGNARLRVYDANGRLVRTLADGPREAGAHTVTWDGRDQAGRGAASGVYFVRLEAGGKTDARKMVLLK